ncbi:MAG: inositol oxygenase family protein [Myxococcota bacterium]
MDTALDRDGYRDFGEGTRPGVRDFYAQNHREQTLDFVLGRKADYLPLRRGRMGVWDAVERLEEIADESDPDLELSQLQHALQTAEALRADGRPRWMILTGFIHDLGKVLCLFGEPQWAVVGDTFPVGCAFSDRIVYPELFAANPDSRDPRLSTPLGIYEPHCGLDRLHLSWGHDEYLYHVVRDHLPGEALDIIRYHSFYAAHREGAYAHLLAEGDEARLDGVRDFNAYDLYSKVDEPLDLESVRADYEELVAEFLPAELQW